jgi:hypothetical protein
MVVSISSIEEKFVIQLRHKINYVVEKKFGRIKSFNNKQFMCLYNYSSQLLEIIFLVVVPQTAAFFFGDIVYDLRISL